jgi:hypothetical protein
MHEIDFGDLLALGKQGVEGKGDDLRLPADVATSVAVLVAAYP